MGIAGFEPFYGFIDLTHEHNFDQWPNVMSISELQHGRNCLRTNKTKPMEVGKGDPEQKEVPYLQGVGEDLSERDKKRKPRRTLDKASPLIR